MGYTVFSTCTYVGHSHGVCFAVLRKKNTHTHQISNQFLGPVFNQCPASFQPLSCQFPTSVPPVSNQFLGPVFNQCPASFQSLSCQFPTSVPPVSNQFLGPVFNQCPASFQPLSCQFPTSVPPVSDPCPTSFLPVSSHFPASFGPVPNLCPIPASNQCHASFYLLSYPFATIVLPVSNQCPTSFATSVLPVFPPKLLLPALILTRYIQIYPVLLFLIDGFLYKHRNKMIRADTTSVRIPTPESSPIRYLKKKKNEKIICTLRIDHLQIIYRCIAICVIQTV